VIAEPRRHRWRLLIQRLMLTAKIIPRDEQRLHSRVVTQALAVAVREASEPPHAHTVGQVKSFNVRSRYTIFIAITEHGKLFDVGYRRWRVAGLLLAAGVVLYQDREVYLRLEREGDVHPVGCEAIGGQLEAARPGTHTPSLRPTLLIALSSW
jgi:hypothetical protein